MIRVEEGPTLTILRSEPSGWISVSTGSSSRRIAAPAPLYARRFSFDVCTAAMSRSNAPTSTFVSVLDALNGTQLHRLQAVVLEHDGAGVLVGLDLRADRQFSFALSIGAKVELDHAERI